MRQRPRFAPVRQQDLVVDQAAGLRSVLHSLDESLVAQADLLAKCFIPQVHVSRRGNKWRIPFLGDTTILGVFHFAAQEIAMDGIGIQPLERKFIPT